MQIKSKKGFFLVETLVVIGILGIVVTLLFRSFYNLYAAFSASEYYNTVSASNAAYNVYKYFNDQNASFELVGDFRDITEDYDNEYYNRLIEELEINTIYLINPNQINNILEEFDVLFRRYLLTLEDETENLIVVITKDGEYGIMKVGN